MRGKSWQRSMVGIALLAVNNGGIAVLINGAPQAAMQTIDDHAANFAEAPHTAGSIVPTLEST